MTVGLSTIPEFRSGQGSALLNMTRQVSTSLGIAMVTYVLMHQTAFHVERLSEGINQVRLLRSAAYRQPEAAAGAFGGPGGLNQLVSSLVHRQAAVQATAAAFLVATHFAVLAIPIGFFLTPARVAREREKQEKLWQSEELNSGI